MAFLYNPNGISTRLQLRVSHMENKILFPHLPNPIIKEIFCSNLANPIIKEAKSGPTPPRLASQRRQNKDSRHSTTRPHGASPSWHGTSASTSDWVISVTTTAPIPTSPPKSYHCHRYFTTTTSATITVPSQIRTHCWFGSSANLGRSPPGAGANPSCQMLSLYIITQDDLLRLL